MTDLDLGVHHVRTPAGAARYHRPIGAVIGTWPDVPRSQKVTAAKAAASAAVAAFGPPLPANLTPGPDPKPSKASRAKSAVKGAAKSAKQQAQAQGSSFKTGHSLHKGLKALPDKDKIEAVRELRLAVRGEDTSTALIDVTNQALLRVAIDPKQHPRIRAAAKKELAKRVTDSSKAHKLHRDAALEALKHGEQPHAFLGISGAPLTEFQKALIKLNPRYGNALVKVLQKVHRSEAAKKVRKGKAVAKEHAVDHVKETKKGTIHKGTNMVALGVAGALASQVARGLGMDPTETIKKLLEFLKEAAI